MTLLMSRMTSSVFSAQPFTSSGGAAMGFGCFCNFPNRLSGRAGRENRPGRHPVPGENCQTSSWCYIERPVIYLMSYIRAGPATTALHGPSKNLDYPTQTSPQTANPRPGQSHQAGPGTA